MDNKNQGAAAATATERAKCQQHQQQQQHHGYLEGYSSTEDSAISSEPLSRHPSNESLDRLALSATTKISGMQFVIAITLDYAHRS